MAGHSQWANRKHRKERQDAKKGRIFSKMARRIAVAAREGGGDPETNPTLRVYIEKAKSLDVPHENIERAIKRGTGDLDGVAYESVTYEGYGPGGVAIYLDILTDNRNRTAQEIRHLFTKHGGNLGESGCVAWMFKRLGYLAFSPPEPFDEEEVFLPALEAGAENWQTDEDMVEIFTPPEALSAVREALTGLEIEPEVAEVRMVPQTEVAVEGGEARQLLRLIEELEDHDDVEDVYANFNMPEEELVAHGA